MIIDCFVLTDDCCSSPCFSVTVVYPGEKNNPFVLQFIMCASFVLHLNIAFLSFSPIKIPNFECHYNKLQADSHYLLSDEYEVSFFKEKLEITTVSMERQSQNGSALKPKPQIPFFCFVPVRTWKMLAVISLRIRLCCPRTVARTDTTTSFPVSQSTCSPAKNTDHDHLDLPVDTSLTEHVFVLRWLNEGEAVLCGWWSLFWLHQRQLHPRKVHLICVPATRLMC